MKHAFVEIKNQGYEIGSLPALTQFHVVRRLAPMIGAVGMDAATLKSAASLKDFSEFIAPVVDQLARMTDEDANYVIFSCLAVVKRKAASDGSLARVVASDGRSLMFDDIDMTVMVRLVVEVLKVSLSGFFSELGAVSDSPGS